MPVRANAAAFAPNFGFAPQGEMDYPALTARHRTEFERNLRLSDLLSRHGIELVADKRAKTAFDPRRRVGAEVCANVRKHGVIVRPLGDVVVLMPPPAMGLEDLRTIVDAVAKEVAAT